MNKKNIKTLISISLMSLILTTFLSTGSIKASKSVAINYVHYVTRTAGETRYKTAFEVAIANWRNSDNVILASGEGYADGLSASTLAKKLDAPILLTTPNTLSEEASNALNILKPKNIYVIGGTASVSQKIRDNLKNKYTVIELGGATRYETNIKVANKLVELGANPSNVLAVSGEGFSDAISAAPAAAAKGEILLLANNNKDSIKQTINFVKGNKSKVVVIGTDKVINNTIYNYIGATKRIDGGEDRFSTNLKILREFKDDFNYKKIYVAAATVQNPDNLYADALVATSVAGKYSAPLVLVNNNTYSYFTRDVTSDAIDYITSNAMKNIDKSNVIQLIGGSEVIPFYVEDDIEHILRSRSHENPL
ncbi:cell wall-binding repeat-containing protein [Clostridium drakei]|uniref:Cell wall-binding protein n=1 Tax=Clostridium drakei TaxID=332101 RepID=A0A2U8DLV6_9CLOT|nr:cell wall-binding repeat-containing protein [Clostridium drakei]AWI03548.1 cell wall-binding protein [Clostridium drakei]